jgi:hypothetical protein
MDVQVWNDAGQQVAGEKTSWCAPTASLDAGEVLERYRWQQSA